MSTPDTPLSLVQKPLPSLFAEIHSFLLLLDPASVERRTSPALTNGHVWIRTFPQEHT